MAFHGILIAYSPYIELGSISFPISQWLLNMIPLKGGKTVAFFTPQVRQGL